VGELVAQPLDLLQHSLELVLGPVQLLGQPDYVRPAGQTEVPPQQIDRVETHARQRCGVLRAQREQPAEARFVHQRLERLGRVRLGLLVQRPDLLLGRLCAVSPVCHRLPPSVVRM
jgi:hypothetical protein